MKNKLLKFTAISLILLMSTFMIFGCGNSAEDGVNGGDLDLPISQGPNIGISWCDDIDVEEYGEDLQAYVDAVVKAGGNPVLFPLFESLEEADAALDMVVALILTGGEDIDPVYYNEEPHENLEEVNEARDKSDFLLLEAALERDFPVLAICRGIQVLNVFSGGSLYQDLPTQLDSDISHRDLEEEDFEYHDIFIWEGSHLADIFGSGTMNVNSWHHQGIKELGDNLLVTAIADDDTIEGIQREDASFIIGVQFHPEWHVDDGDMEFLKIFEKMVSFGDL